MFNVHYPVNVFTYYTIPIFNIHRLLNNATHHELQFVWPHPPDGPIFQIRNPEATINAIIRNYKSYLIFFL